MHFYKPTKQLFDQLQVVLQSLSDAQYVLPVLSLSQATIGQHIRHIIELFTELNNGYETGTVEYEKRKRNYLIESDRRVAMQQLDRILNSLQKPDKELQLYADYETTDSAGFYVTTNYDRELVYNLEHTVHHMALIRIGICEVSEMPVPAEFGVAASTVKFRNGICVR